ncbi:MAG: outer membrane protein assembly factor BamD, partial [Bacteroidota bacterium]|nr:outer membrane protein assembly factor BamD [Bacteroidota bacterium]
MFLRMRSILLLCLAAVALASCSEYQKVLKETDLKPKYDMAEKLYNEGDYKRAVRLFEQIAPKYVGRPQGERVMFFFADSYFKTKDYYLAGYQFERFMKSYPRSDKIQEAGFLGAKSYYMLSPRYSLDQSDTDKALSKLQVFINTYPDSEYFEEANAMAAELTAKKEKKELEIAKQLNKLGEFNLPILVS